MIDVPTKKIKPYRYSPLPIEAYDKVLSGRSYGPSQSAFLSKSVEAWNLAFLCHPYGVDGSQPEAAQFTTAVRNTVNYVLDAGAIDLIGNAPADMKVQGLLRLDAKAFVRMAFEDKRFKQTPVYQLLGDKFFSLIVERAPLCLVHPAQLLLDCMDSIPDDMTQACRLLTRFQ